MQPAFDRQFIARELGLQDSSASRALPLLYHLTHTSNQEGSGGRGVSESPAANERAADVSRRAMYSDDDSQRPQRIDRTMLS